VQLAEIAKII